MLLEDYLVSDVTEAAAGIGQQESPGDAKRTAEAGRQESVGETQRTAKAGRQELAGRPGPGDRNGQTAPEAEAHSWMQRRYLPFAGENSLFVPGQCIQIENARYLKIGSFTADITRLTALTENGQPGSLTWLLEKLLFTESNAETDLRVRCESGVETLFSDSMDAVLSSRIHRYELWLEQVRSLDLLMAACRLRPNTATAPGLTGRDD